MRLLDLLLRALRRVRLQHRWLVVPHGHTRTDARRGPGPARMPISFYIQAYSSSYSERSFSFSKYFYSVFMSCKVLLKLLFHIMSYFKRYISCQRALLTCAQVQLYHHPWRAWLRVVPDLAGWRAGACASSGRCEGLEYCEGAGPSSLLSGQTS